MSEVVIPILNHEYKVVVCWGKNLEKTIEKWGYKDWDFEFNRRGETLSGINLHPVIVLYRAPDTPEYIGTLAHEAVHAINAIFDYIDEGNRNGEVFAHSVGAAVREVLEFIDKKKK